MYPSEGSVVWNGAGSPDVTTAVPAASPVSEAFERVLRTQSAIGDRIHALRDRLAVVLRMDPPTKDGSVAQPREVGQSDMHQALLNAAADNAALVEQLENILRRLTV